MTRLFRPLTTPLITRPVQALKGVDRLNAAGDTLPINTLQPSISGTPQVGQTLTCAPGNWMGLAPITFAYQWLRDGAEIPDADESTYLLEQSDIGASITCRVTATNSAGSSNATANPVGPVVPVPLSLSGSPVASAEKDVAYVGFAVTAEGGIPPYTFALVGDWPAGITIDDATGLVSGTPTEDGPFPSLNVEVTDAALSTAELPSSFALTVVSVPVNNSAPVITSSGTTTEDTASLQTPGSWSGYPAPVLTHQWRDDLGAIPGQSNPAALPLTNEEGRSVYLRETAINSAGSDFADSNSIGPITAPAEWSPLDLPGIDAWWTRKAFTDTWLDEVAGQPYTMTGATYSPSGWPGTNADRVVFDGLDDSGVLPAPAGWPIEAQQGYMLVVVNQKRPAGTVSHDTIFGYGENGATSRTIGRRVTSGVNRVKADTGNGTTLVERQYTTIDFSGVHVILVEYVEASGLPDAGANRVDLSVDGGPVQSTSIVPQSVNNRSRIGAGPHNPAGSFSMIDVREALVGSGRLSTSDRNRLIAWALTSAGLNLLSSLSWVQGASTTMTIANGRARATRAGSNPRIYKQVTALTIGATYRLRGNVYIGNSDSVILRVSDTTAIGTDGPYASPSWTTDQAVDVTFVADATTQYIGLIGVTTIDGRYVEIDDNFALEYVSGP